MGLTKMQWNGWKKSSRIWRIREIRTNPAPGVSAGGCEVQIMSKPNFGILDAKSEKDLEEMERQLERKYDALLRGEPNEKQNEPKTG